MVLEMMCVTFSMGIEPSRRGSHTVAPLSCTILESCSRLASLIRREVALV